MQHNNESSDAQSQTFSFDFGDIKRLKGSQLRFYYCYVTQGGFIYLRLAGVADYDEIMRFSTQLINDESWPNVAKIFTDLRWYDSSPLIFDTYFEMTRKLAKLYEKNARHYGKQVALCSNESEYGLHRMFQSILDDGKRVLGTFRDIEQAVSFHPPTGLSLPQRPPLPKRQEQEDGPGQRRQA